MVLPANAIVEALEISVNELIFAGREPRLPSSSSFLTAFLTFLALLAPICRVTPKTPFSTPPYPPAADTRLAHAGFLLRRSITGPGAADPGASRLRRPAGPAAPHLVLNEQCERREARRQG